MNAREREYARLRATMPRPAVQGSPADAFESRFTAQKGICARLGTPGEAVDYVRRTFGTPDGSLCVTADPLLAGLDWSASGLRVQPAGERPACTLGVTTALCAVAETGSLAVSAGEAAPFALNFLPDRLVIVVRETDIVANLEDFWTRMRERFGGAPPRALCLVSGPSTSGDVEMQFATGVHGPIEVHALLLP